MYTFLFLIVPNIAMMHANPRPCHSVTTRCKILLPNIQRRQNALYKYSKCSKFVENILILDSSYKIRFLSSREMI
jgi:hypothetical protein